MTKEEFLAISLPYKLYVMYDNLIIKHDYSNISGCISHISDVMPILHPLSDLSNRIEYKGRLIIPAVELGVYKGANAIKECPRAIVEEKGDIKHRIIGFHNYTYLTFTEVLKLIEWHFAIGLDESEYIDVNTLPENPYK